MGKKLKFDELEVLSFTKTHKIIAGSDEKEKCEHRDPNSTGDSGNHGERSKEPSNYG